MFKVGDIVDYDCGGPVARCVVKGGLNTSNLSYKLEVIEEGFYFSSGKILDFALEKQCSLVRKKGEIIKENKNGYQIWNSIDVQEVLFLQGYKWIGGNSNNIRILSEAEASELRWILQVYPLDKTILATQQIKDLDSKYLSTIGEVITGNLLKKKGVDYDCNLIRLIGCVVKGELNTLVRKEGGEEEKMHSFIIELFPKTEEAVLVDAYMGSSFSDPVIRALSRGKEKEILEEARRMKEAFKKLEEGKSYTG